jgi:membrane-bound lytic murein transglycosylase A
VARASSTAAALLIAVAQAMTAQADDTGRDDFDAIAAESAAEPSANSENIEAHGSESGELLQTQESERKSAEAAAPTSVILDSDRANARLDESESRDSTEINASRRDHDKVMAPGGVAKPDANPASTILRESGPFVTKHAWYVPVSWVQIPGWRDSVTVGAWSTFVQSCAVLTLRLAWRETCERARAYSPTGPDSAREFFEREFEALQIRTIDFSETGTLTGYYEPLLEGSRIRTPRFQYPVYGVPKDLFFLDARILKMRPLPAYVRIEGRDLVAVREGALLAERSGHTKLYRLAVSRAPAMVRDRKIRVRISGDRIVPYFTRQEINRRGLASAQPIAWVDDPDLLYALHIEGAGRIRLGTGEILRVAFGEQNGHPFLPTVHVDSQRTVHERRHDEEGSNSSVTAEGNSQVQRVIDFLLTPAAASESEAGETLDQHQTNVTEEVGPRIVVSSHKDPSYVFFRQIPNTGSGPPGAMGVPLTPGSSLAVDPRVTPLGAPVFIAVRQSGSTMTRLMVAQDTGGAIRGAVRADYFLGFGPSAAAAAMRMKDELRMWILLPKSLAIASKHAQSQRIRSGSAALRTDCLLPDPEFCVE